MRILRVMLVALILLAVAVSCGSMNDPSNFTPVEDPSFLPDRDSDIEGTITKVEEGSGATLLRILVEERPGDRSGSLKDFVTIIPDTRIYRESGERLRDASVDELREGSVVAAWYDGSVKESYPRQATAVAVVIAE